MFILGYPGDTPFFIYIPCYSKTYYNSLFLLNIQIYIEVLQAVFVLNTV